jgi:hypothetical protein
LKKEVITMKMRRAIVWLFYLLITLACCFRTAFCFKENGFSTEVLFFSSLAVIGFYYMLTSKTP